MVDLQVEIAGVTFQNPVLAASGTFGYGLEFASLFDLNRLGGIVIKGLSARPMDGNPSPRLAVTSSGMLNSIGLQNIGASRFIESKLPFLRTLKVRTVANVFGFTLEDYVECIHILNDAEGIAAYELNISCPNTSRGGAEFSSEPQLTHEVVAEAKRAARRPLWVKLSPNVGNISVFARAAVEAGADALTLVNTFLGLAVDIETGKPRISRVMAGLSGPAIKPLALRMVHQVARAVSVPILGVGGIATTEDALEFLMAGASAVEIGTASFFDPMATMKIAHGLESYCLRSGISNLKGLVGSLTK